MLQDFSKYYTGSSLSQGPILAPLNSGCRSNVIRNQKGPIILRTTHIDYIVVLAAVQLPVLVFKVIHCNDGTATQSSEACTEKSCEQARAYAGEVKHGNLGGSRYSW